MYFQQIRNSKASSTIHMLVLIKAPKRNVIFEENLRNSEFSFQILIKISLIITVIIILIW